MKPEEFVAWLEERVQEVQTARSNITFVSHPIQFACKGAQITAFKQVLDYYKKHAITQQFN